MGFLVGGIETGGDDDGEARRWARAEARGWTPLSYEVLWWTVTESA